MSRNDEIQGQGSVLVGAAEFVLGGEGYRNSSGPRPLPKWPKRDFWRPRQALKKVPHENQQQLRSRAKIGAPLWCELSQNQSPATREGSMIHVGPATTPADFEGRQRRAVNVHSILRPRSCFCAAPWLAARQVVRSAVALQSLPVWRGAELLRLVDHAVASAHSDQLAVQQSLQVGRVPGGGVGHLGRSRRFLRHAVPGGGYRFVGSSLVLFRRGRLGRSAQHIFAVQRQTPSAAGSRPSDEYARNPCIRSVFAPPG